jgi:hypothetical protein
MGDSDSEVNVGTGSGVEDEIMEAVFVGAIVLGVEVGSVCGTSFSGCASLMVHPLRSSINISRQSLEIGCFFIRSSPIRPPHSAR